LALLAVLTADGLTRVSNNTIQVTTLMTKPGRSTVRRMKGPFDSAVLSSLCPKKSGVILHHSMNSWFSP